MFLKNELIRYADQTQRTLRILWIDHARTHAYVFELEARASHPQRVTYATLMADVQSRRANLLVRDPYVVQVDPSTLPPRYLAVRDRAWDIVRALAAHEPDIYQPRSRGPLVMAYSERHGVTHPSIYRYLRRYWERGQNADALLPDYANSGARGKTRGSRVDVKRGRPRKAGSPPGVNADLMVRATFRSAVARYVATHERFSRRGAYRQMIEDFYQSREAGALPTFGQFSYWIDKDAPLRAAAHRTTQVHHGAPP